METWSSRQESTPWIAFCLKELCTKYNTRRSSNCKVTSMSLVGAMVIKFQYRQVNQQGFQDDKSYLILLLPQGTYFRNIRFVCHQQQTYEGISLLLWIQGFHSYKSNYMLLLPYWTSLPNIKFLYLHTAML